VGNDLSTEAIAFAAGDEYHKHLVKKVLDFLMNQKLYNNNTVITTALTGKNP
jgi:hypothetical protein